MSMLCYGSKKSEGAFKARIGMVINIANEHDKNKKKLRWLRWKNDVLLREVRLKERLRKSGAHRP